MIRDGVDSFISFLNEALVLDPEAISSLFKCRIGCNDTLVAHPTIQVSSKPDIGILGLINGYFGTIDNGPRAGWGPIAAIYDRLEGQIVRFERTDVAAIIEPPQDLG